MCIERIEKRHNIGKQILKLYIHKNKNDNKHIQREREEFLQGHSLSLYSLTKTPALSLGSWEGRNLN